MKVSQIINQPTFKGYSQHIFDGSKKSLLFGYRRLYFDNEKSLQQAIKETKTPIPEPSVEKTLGAFHTRETDKVYFADPHEVVSDDIRARHDYIVYDNEPSYPDVNKEVSRNYFGTERKNYAEEFRDIHDYYKRAEDADWKTLDEIKHDERIPFDKKREKVAYYEHRIDEAKYQENQAKTCEEIYHEGGALRYNKEQYEDSNAHLEKRINEINQRTANNNADIANEQKLNAERKKQLATLKERIKRSQALKNYTDNCSYATTAEKQQVSDFLQSRIGAYESLKQELKNSEKKIAKLIVENEQAPKLIQEFRETIAKNQALIEETKAKLIPIFDKLKNYYITQGIKVIKKI